jgi:PHD/YefM family antitoxin component YafN of YafNO toxin-antitoxin module
MQPESLYRPVSHLYLVQRTVRVPVEEYESMKETLEVLRDQRLVKSIARGLEDLRRGRTVPHSEVRKRIRSR